MSNYSKQDLAKAVAEAGGMSAKAAQEAIGHVFAAVGAAAEAGHTVSIPGFGKFLMKERAARLGRNPATGEPLQIAASRKLTFRPSAASKTS